VLTASQEPLRLWLKVKALRVKLQGSIFWVFLPQAVSNQNNANKILRDLIMDGSIVTAI
jgi:hypothetical protein